jgi:hypothetical protein
MRNIVLTPERWCSKYPPGWPLLLALGQLTSAPWLVNPVLLALCVWATFRVGSDLFDAPTGLTAAVALAVSPFGLLMGAGFMSHVACLCAFLWCLHALLRTSGEPRSLCRAGALGAACFLIRPVSAALLLWAPLAATLSRLEGRRASALGWLLVGAAPGLLVFLGFNALAFGNPFLTGYRVYEPNETFTGMLGEQRSLPALVAAHLPWYVSRLNASLWGFPWPDLLILLPLLRPGAGRCRDWLLAASAASLVLGYSAYYFADVVYSGPRFAFEALGPLSLLAARSLLSLARWLAAGPTRLRGALVAASATALLVFPLARRLPEQARLHAECYQGQCRAPLRVLEERGVARDALVLVAGEGFKLGSFFLENSLDPLRGPRIFVRDVPRLREQAAVLLPRPQIWRVELELEPLPGPNPYRDRYRFRGVSLRRLRARELMR